jgi:putative cell wall-binding protein
MRTLGVAVAAMMLAIGLVTVDSRTTASAITGSEFDPGNIISDDEFYNGSAMTEAQIQSFLNSQTGILKSLRRSVDTRPKEISDTTDNLICEEIAGGTNLLASTMIYRAQVACGISAKVILVTLEKEQSLITKQYPRAWNINKAMGYDCPDSTGCSPYYEGFGNQVYNGTRQLKTYKAAHFLRQPGTHTIAYHPNNADCGTKSINVTNYATAALYNYTPYVPNAAALKNLGGVGDECSSYGNRNFWSYYYSWFGNPTDITPSAAVERIGGADRYAVSAALVNKNYPTSGIARVYVTTGVNFADALSASTAAAAAKAPLLLVSSTSVPASIKTELQRLAPKEIILLGGPSVVSNEVLNALKTMSPSVSRVYGADRYETSRLIAGKSFLAGTTTSAFIATGDSFPDALSASSAAATGGGPMILVKGSASSLDAPTLDLLSSLGVTKVSIAGGSAAVSAGIESQLVSRLGDANVTRYGGANRFDTSVKINNAGFASSSTVYLATGYNFPDALSGAAIAGATVAPLYIVHTSCVPKSVLQAVKDLGATKVVVLGGTGALDSSVALYDNCA